jgi:hypothetical protein
VVLKRGVQVLNSFLKFSISIIGQTSFVKELRLGRFSTQSIGKIFNSFRILSDINVDIASLHQKFVIFALTLKCFIEIVESLFEVLH